MSLLRSASVGRTKEPLVKNPRVVVIVNVLLSAALIGAYFFYRHLGN